MANAILKFDLSEPDEIRDHLAAIHGMDMALLLWEFKHNILRKAMKDALSPSEICQLIHEYIDNLGFDIDDIVV